MTCQVTIKNDSSNDQQYTQYKLHIKVYDRSYDEFGNKVDTLVTEVWLEPQEEHQMYVWDSRWFETFEVTSKS